jgi:outer membrane protein TolC
MFIDCLPWINYNQMGYIMKIHNRYKKWMALAMVGIGSFKLANAQEQKTLLLSEAVQTGIINYQSIQAKQNYVRSSAALVENTKNQYLPNVIGSIQQAYGTINGQFGAYSPYGAAGVASAGPNYTSQSWNAAFGSVYVINTNWEAFTFGRKKAEVNYAISQLNRDSADVEQERFVQSVRISGAYLNLLVAQTLIKNAQANLERANYIRDVVMARTVNGLNPGVDSSIVNAEVSNAKLVLYDAINNEQQYNNQLAQLINASTIHYITDSTFLKDIPKTYSTAMTVDQNPQVKFYQSRVLQSNSLANYYSKSILPSINLFGIFQSKGSGFKSDYTPISNEDYTTSYLSGINPSRTNYAAGVSIAWNFLSPLKIKQRVISQRFISSGLQNETDLVSTQLKDQLYYSDQRIETSLQKFREAPIQYKSASDAYNQKSVLYKNGLTNIVDLQQALYLVNRAETDQSVAYVNVWQALLQKAAASGDFDLFIKQAR